MVFICVRSLRRPAPQYSHTIYQAVRCLLTEVHGAVTTAAADSWPGVWAATSHTHAELHANEAFPATVDGAVAMDQARLFTT